MPFGHVCGFGSGCDVWVPFRCFLGWDGQFWQFSVWKSCATHLRRLLSSITHLIPSIVQFEHVTSPSELT